VKPIPEEQAEELKNAAVVFLKSVFDAMKIEAEIEAEYSQEDGTVNCVFSGEEMGIIIGKRGQTLDSLQYLTSLVVNKKTEDYIRVKLDTEDYRARRADTLNNLARNIAYKVKKTHRSVALEPMNPYERRIIHSSLQGNRFVETYSEGEEPYRHVVVTPKR
jgi:spoIIIJ-associated protein